MKSTAHPITHHSTPSKAGICLIGALLLFADTISADTISKAGSWPGYTRHIASLVSGDGMITCLLGSDGLQIFDLSKPQAPQARGFLPCFTPYVEAATDLCLQSESNRICIGVRVSELGHYTYLLRGIDVVDPVNPAVVWNGRLYHRPNQICLEGTRAYASHNTSGLSSSTWGASGYGGAISTVTNAWGRAVFEGDRLYVPTISGFQVFDKATFSLVGTFLAGAEGKALAVSNNYAYLATTDGFRVVDVQNDTAPNQVGFLALAPDEFGPTDVQLLANHACLTFENTNLLMVVDISVPESPEWVGSYVFTGPTKDLSVSDGLAFVMAADSPYGSSDLHTIDISDPTNPTFEARLYSVGSTKQLALKDAVLFLADGNNGLCILDCDNPLALDVTSHYFTQGGCIALEGELAMLGDATGFSVINISDPTDPWMVTNSWQAVNHMQAVEEHLFSVGGLGMPEFMVMDMANGFTETAHLYWIDGINQVGAFSMVGNLVALLIDEWQGNLVAIDVQSPGLPVVTNYLGLSKIVDVVGHVDSQGTNAFLATTNGLEVLDLSNMNNILRIAGWECLPKFTPQCICVDGDRIGLASTNHLWVIDRNQLEGGNPVIAETDIAVSISDMVLSGDYLYAAAGADGVIVFQIGSAIPQPTLVISEVPPNHINLQWDSAGTGWMLEQSDTSLTGGVWTEMLGSENVTSTNLERTVPMQFFRLTR